GAANTVDPLGGSYCIEWLTSEIEKRAQEYLDRIDSMGGAIKAIEKGFLQQEIADSAYSFQREVEDRTRLIVGVNVHRSEEKAIERMRVDPGIERVQAESIGQLRKERDEDRARASLSNLKESAEGDENMIEPILECVKNYVTLGEISDVLRSVFTVYSAQDLG
ncbi:MAG: methylmalonyl-CoA mutase family protein, partial [Thermoplasmata archaeon]